jgi:peroxiredoxin
MSRIAVGTRCERLELDDIRGEKLSIPSADRRLTHLQFRRFAGCPICNLHLQSFIREQEQLAAAGIQEVAVFHSSADALLAQPLDARFSIIADPEQDLYRRFGVESGWRSVFHPRAMTTALRGLVSLRAPLPALTEPHLGLPADFLIDAGGVVIDAYYGRHADDQWTVDAVLDRARFHGRSPVAAV